MLNSKNLNQSRNSFLNDRLKSKDPDAALTQSRLKLSLRSSNSNNSRDRYSKTSYDSPRPDRLNGHHSGRMNRFDNDSDEEGITSSRSLDHHEKQRSSSPPPYVTPRFGASRDPLRFDEDVLARRKLVGHLAPLQPLESYGIMLINLVLF